MTQDTGQSRRQFTRALAGAGTAGLVFLAGCGGDGGGGEKPSFDGWLDDTDNYDQVHDRTRMDTTVVQVGVEANGGFYGFGPAVIEVSPGTTVRWDWTGEGGMHNVSNDGGAFESDLFEEPGVHFEHEFSSSGTYKYTCEPHDALGMRGVVVVE